MPHLFEPLQVRGCTLCAHALPHPPRPVLQVHPHARILVVGQAPGSRVQAGGIPFDDPRVVPLPHPSPRNNILHKRNAWFVEEVVPALQDLVAHILKGR